MGWVKISDDAPEHPKLDRLGNAAMRVWFRGLCYSAAQLTDGMIPRRKAMAWAVEYADSEPGSVVSEIVESGLWHDTGNGHFEVHDYLDYNPPREKEEARRAAATERMRKLRSREQTGERSASQSGERSSERDALRSREHGDETCSREQTGERSHARDAARDAVRDAARDAARSCVPSPSPSPFPFPSPSPSSSSSPGVRTNVQANVPANADDDDEASAFASAVEPELRSAIGRPMLSAEDGRVLLAWHRDGIDVAVVLTAVRRVAEKAPDHISTARYFDRAVRSDWRGVQKLRAPLEAWKEDAAPEWSVVDSDRWRAAVKSLRGKVSDEDLETGIGTLLPVYETDSEIGLLCRSEKHRRWVEPYLELMTEAADCTVKLLESEAP